MGNVDLQAQLVGVYAGARESADGVHAHKVVDPESRGTRYADRSKFYLEGHFRH